MVRVSRCLLVGETRGQVLIKSAASISYITCDPPYVPNATAAVQDAAAEASSERHRGKFQVCNCDANTIPTDLPQSVVPKMKLLGRMVERS